MRARNIIIATKKKQATLYNLQITFRSIANGGRLSPGTPKIRKGREKIWKEKRERKEKRGKEKKRKEERGRREKRKKKEKDEKEKEGKQKEKRKETEKEEKVCKLPFTFTTLGIH